MKHCNYRFTLYYFILFIWLLCIIISIILQVKDYLKRFASIPDIMELHHLTVSGDVTFGKGVTLKVRQMYFHLCCRPRVSSLKHIFLPSLF